MPTEVKWTERPGVNNLSVIMWNHHSHSWILDVPEEIQEEESFSFPIILHFSASFSQFHLLFSLFLSSLPSPPYLTTPGKFMLLLKLFLIKIWCNYLPLKLPYSSLLTNCWCLLPQKWLHSLLNRDTTFISVCYIHTVKKKWYIMCNNIQDVLGLPKSANSVYLRGARGTQRLYSLWQDEIACKHVL